MSLLAKAIRLDIEVAHSYDTFLLKSNRRNKRRGRVCGGFAPLSTFRQNTTP
jgi:hypothetical protein